MSLCQNGCWQRLGPAKQACTLPKHLVSRRWHATPRKRSKTQGVSSAAFIPADTSLQACNQAQALPTQIPFVFADLPNVFSALHIQTPSIPTVFFFLLSHPFVTLSLAVFLYVTIPRLWRAFIKFVVIPTALLGAGIVVVKNPESFRNAGTFVAHFTSDHPYVTSGGILIALGLLLSPYVLTALLALFIATGVPRLPAPVRNFLPAPFLEVEQQIAGIDSVVRGPINVAKEKALQLGSGITATGSSFFSSGQNKLLQSQESVSAPSLTERSEVAAGRR